MNLTGLEGGDRPWKITPHGIEISRELTVEEYRALGQRLGGLVNGLQWAIGDWLVYGEGRGQFGESYELAAALTDKSHESLSQAARVSSAFPIHERVRELPWTWHRVALGLPEAKRLPTLRRAHEERWARMQFVGHVTSTNTNAVKRAIASGRPLTTNQLKTSEWRRVKRDYVQCPDCGHKFQVQISRAEPRCQNADAGQDSTPSLCQCGECERCRARDRQARRRATVAYASQREAGDCTEDPTWVEERLAEEDDKRQQQPRSRC